MTTRVLLSSLLALAGSASAGTLSVTSTSPADATVGASTSASVVVTFDAAVDAATITSDTVRAFGRWSGTVDGTLTADGATVTFRPSRPYFPGEMVTVRLSRDVATPGGATLDGGHAFHFWARSAPGTGTFSLAGTISTRLPGEGLVQSYGIYAGDLDADGAPDFSIPNETADDVRVLMNDGCGSYGPLGVYDVPFGSTPSSNEGEDFDRDGDMDFACASIGSGNMNVLMGDGTGAFAPTVAYASGSNARGLSILDAEADGDIDIIVAHRSSSDMGLHRNDGSGVFLGPTLFDGGGSGETAVSVADADGDGDEDLFVGLYNSDAVSCLLNDGTGAFTVSDVTAAGNAPWMTAVGDVDLDGDVDVATCNAFSDDLSVIRTDGAGGLLPATNLMTGDFPLAVDLGDWDGDGDLDLVGSSFGDALWTAWVNDGTGTFGSPFGLGADTTASCMTIVDDDRDGFVDLVGVDEFADIVFLYRQDVASVPGTQPPGCGATLRIDNLAARAGFGGTAPHEVAAGGSLFVGVTAGAGETYWLTAGAALEPGVASPFGIYNLADAPLILVSGVTNADGEALLDVDVPASTPTGLDVALQTFVAGPGGFVLTNPEVVRLVP